MAGGFGAAELKAGGFGLAELKAGGFGVAELTAGGFKSIAEAKAGGLDTPAELFAAGYTTCAEYRGLGFSFRQLCSTGRPDGKPFSSREVATAYGWTSESSMADLRNTGADWAIYAF
jgi:hypothetical protein